MWSPTDATYRHVVGRINVVSMIFRLLERMSCINIPGCSIFAYLLGITGRYEVVLHSFVCVAVGGGSFLQGNPHWCKSTHGVGGNRMRCGCCESERLTRLSLLLQSSIKSCQRWFWCGQGEVYSLEFTIGSQTGVMANVLGRFYVVGKAGPVARTRTMVHHRTLGDDLLLPGPCQPKICSFTMFGNM